MFGDVTDLILLKNGASRFSWGTYGAYAKLEVEGKTRSDYLAALKKADQNDFTELIAFARS